MLIIRRGYFTARLENLTRRQTQNISVEKFLRTTNRSCPKRNHILGQHFCRFVVKVDLYVNATKQTKSIDTNVLHKQYEEAIAKLDLCETNSSHVQLPTSAHFLSESVSQSLMKWKQNSHDEVRDHYSSLDDIRDNMITETVRAINYSLIGWYLQKYGMQNTLAFIQWLGVPITHFPDLPKPSLEVNHDDTTQRKLDRLLDGYEKLEQKLQYNFEDRALLLQSVSHESFTLNDLTPSYSGLDFAGDAILNYVIVRHLFRRSAVLNADDLENISSLLRCNSSLATISVRNDLHKYVRNTSPGIRDNVNKLVAFLRQNKFKPVTDFYFIDKRNFIVEVPPIISSSFEALMAAVFFDSKMDLNILSNIVSNLMHWDIQTLCESRPKTAYAELKELDSMAEFSEPVKLAPGQMQVVVTLPNFQNETFVGIARDPQLAKWGAAKNAVAKLRNRKNVYIPATQKELIEHYTKEKLSNISNEKF